MCSPKYIPFMNPPCSLRNIRSYDVYILFKMTMLKTLLVMDSSVIPLQFFLQRLRCTLFGS